MQKDLKITAPIFNIQTYCIHDGPGIRTTVFVKGCPLRCLWCANPESNEARPQLLAYQEKCTGCGACAETCPQKAISMKTEGEKRYACTDRSLCSACGACASVCPASAREIAGTYMTVEECLKKILKDKLFLTGSGGGMTISGGEALVHPEFCEALFHACKENGIHTAIESSSFGSKRAINLVYSQVDLALLDIKHMDPVMHKKLTGVSNEEILSNICYIYHDLHVPAVIRVPVIPGYNADEENISATAKFTAEKLGSDVPIHLLPYHRLGISKSESLGKKGKDDIEVPDAAFMEQRKAWVEAFGLQAKIGG